MVLLLAVHTIHDVTARVPLSMLVLLDCVKRKSLPPSLKCRQVVPSSGKVSISLWDAESVEELELWMNDNIHQDCTTEIQEAQEEFSYGMTMALTQARAADKVSTSSRATLEKVTSSLDRGLDAAASTIKQQLDAAKVSIDAWDQKTRIISKTKEATNTAVTKVRASTDRVLENEKVQTALATVQTGVQAGFLRAKESFNWGVSKVMPNSSFANRSESPSYGAGGAAGYGGGGYDDGVNGGHMGMGGGAAMGYPAPPSYDDSSMATPAAAPHQMPVSTQGPSSGVDAGAAARAWGMGATEEPMPAFTLGDNESFTDSPAPPAAATMEFPASPTVSAPSGGADEVPAAPAAVATH